MMKSTEASEEKLVQSGVVDIELGSLRKQRFRINGDNNRILELNTSDMGIITRLSELYPKLQELADKASLIGAEIDAGMRDYIDKLFDANVSEICAPYGTMYDIVDGQFRYDNIIDSITKLYEANIEKETASLKSRLMKKAEKYLPQDRKKSTKRSK